MDFGLESGWLFCFMCCALLIFQSEHMINVVFLSSALGLSSIWNLCLSVVRSCWSLDSLHGGGWKVVVSSFFSILNMVLFLFFWSNCKMCARTEYVSFSENVWLLLQTALLGYLIRGSILARVCEASVAHQNLAAFVQKQRGLSRQSVSVLVLVHLI